MRYNICKLFTTAPEYSENDVYRKFKYQFDNLFNVGEAAKTKEDFEAMYVPDKDFEDGINGFLQSINSAAKFCVGYTGIGKTTTIRHCLGLGVGSSPVLTTPSKRVPGKFMVIFPTFLDGYMQEDGGTFDLPSRISAVCTTLEEAHPELLRSRKTVDGKKEFYHFLRKHAPHILETPIEWNMIDLPESKRIERRLSFANSNHPLSYYANKLKYYILKKYDIYDRLVIVLDDIESLPEVFQETVISSYLHLFSCMQVTEAPEDSEYRVNLLISVRPHTYRIFSKSAHSGRILESYPIDNPIMKKLAVDLDILFKKRFDYYTTRSTRTVGNRESWDECYNELMRMSQAFDGKYKAMISNLCFMNVRVSLAWYAKIFANRFWIQGNRIKAGAFTVSSPEYNFNNITVIRAIGCGDSSVFTGEDDTIIPNIFYTTPDTDNTIHCLLVMQCFYEEMHKVTTSGPVEYGLAAKKLHKLRMQWSSILDEQRVEQLYSAVVYLFERKVLRKSIKDFDDAETLDLPISLADDSKLYISPRGVELMEMFARDSVLLEMLRECAWREYAGREMDYRQESSYELLRKGLQKDIFLDLLEYIEALREMEESFFFYPGSNLSEYRKIFGNTLVVQRLFSGVERSLWYSGIMSDPTVAYKIHRIKSRIDASTNILQEKAQ